MRRILDSGLVCCLPEHGIAIWLNLVYNWLVDGYGCVAPRQPAASMVLARTIVTARPSPKHGAR